jgi:hypothetical protein
MIALFSVRITHKKTKEVLTTETIARSAEDYQDRFYQRTALRSLNKDPNLEKWDVSNFTFTATIKQVMEQ